MDKLQREISKVEMTIDQLNAVSGGMQNWSSAAWGTVKDGMIAGFEGAGGTVTGTTPGSSTLSWSAGGHTIHF